VYKNNTFNVTAPCVNNIAMVPVYTINDLISISNSSNQFEVQFAYNESLFGTEQYYEFETSI